MKNDRAFTLIEIVLVILLVGIIAGFVGTMLFQESKMFSLIIPRKEAQLEGKLVMERVLREIREAYQGSYNTGSNVRFKIPYSIYKGYTSVNLRLSGNKLLLRTDGGTETTIADTVTFFNVTSVKWTPKRDLVRVKLDLTKDGKVISQQAEVYLRNER